MDQTTTQDGFTLKVGDKFVCGEDAITVTRMWDAPPTGVAVTTCHVNTRRAQHITSSLDSIRHAITANGWKKITLALFAAYLALHALPAHAAPAHDWHAPIPAGCAEVGHFEDGTIIATCGELGSKVLAFDPDGQTHPAAPYREPGTWYAIS